jgi:hypothetical protein
MARVGLKAVSAYWSARMQTSLYVEQAGYRAEHRPAFTISQVARPLLTATQIVGSILSAVLLVGVVAFFAVIQLGGAR